MTMKMKTHIATAAVAMLFAACSNDVLPEAPAVDNLTDTPITVNAGVADLATRAGMTTGDLTALGLFITNEANDKYCFSDIKFEKDADTGEFILTGSRPPLWQNATQPITVWAYSPYNVAWTDITASYDVEVKTSQNVEADLKASDLLWASAEVDPAAATQTGSIRYNNGALDITLEHILSKLTVNVRFGDEFPNMMLAKDGLSIEGLNTKGKFSPANANTNSLSNIAAITACKSQTAANGYDETFETILLPQGGAFGVKIALYGGRTFQWKHNGDFTFASGRSYTLNLVVGKDKVELADGGISVEDWNRGQGGNLVTD